MYVKREKEGRPWVFSTVLDNSTDLSILVPCNPGAIPEEKKLYVGWKRKEKKQLSLSSVEGKLVDNLSITLINPHSSVGT